MYLSQVSVNDPRKLIQRCFYAEDKNIKGKSSYALKEENKKIKFQIKAKNAIALRTSLNSITKMLTVIEKVKALK